MLKLIKQNSNVYKYKTGLYDVKKLDKVLLDE